MKFEKHGNHTVGNNNIAKVIKLINNPKNASNRNSFKQNSETNNNKKPKIIPVFINNFGIAQSPGDGHEKIVTANAR
jgi:hypothetical protein